MLTQIDHLLPRRRILVGHLFKLLYNQNIYSNLTKVCDVAIAIEDSCYNKCVKDCIDIDMQPTFDNKDFKSRYSVACALVMSHLQKDGMIDSSYLIDQLRQDAIDLTKIGYMTSEQLCPQASAHERRIIAIRLNQKVEKKVSTAYICRRCGGNKTLLNEFLARGLEEAPTITVHCENSGCGNKWRLQ